MKLFIKYFFIFSSIIILLNGYCFAEMTGLSENQLKEFVGSEKVCLERAVYDCNKSKEMKTAMGMNKIDINELNDMAHGVSLQASLTVASPPGGYSHQNAMSYPAPQLVEIGKTEIEMQTIELPYTTVFEQSSAIANPISGQEFISVTKTDYGFSGINSPAGAIEIAPQQ